MEKDFLPRNTRTTRKGKRVATRLLALAWLFSLVMPGLRASPGLEMESNTILIDYDERQAALIQTTNLPLSLTVLSPDFPGVPYQLSVTLLQTLDDSQGFDISMHLPVLLAAEGAFLQQTPLLLAEREDFIYQNLEPQFAAQPLPFEIDVFIPQGAFANNYTAILQFTLYELDPEFLGMDPDPLVLQPGGIPVAQMQVLIQVQVREFFTMEVFFGGEDTETGMRPEDTDTRVLDFGLVAPDLERQDRVVFVRLLTNLGQPYRLFQKRDEEMNSEVYHIPFNPDGIFFEVDPATLLGARYYETPRPLVAEDDLIYQSNAAGSQDLVPVVYSIQNIPDLKAGRYRTLLSYYVELTDAVKSLPEARVTFDVFVEIQPQFLFLLTPAGGVFDLDFTPENVLEQFKQHMVRVDIISNLGRPYKFYHALLDGLMNEDGLVYPEENAAYVLTHPDGEPLPDEEFKPVASMDQLLFESDADGESASFTVAYRLDTLHRQMSGLYRANLNFHLATEY